MEADAPGATDPSEPGWVAPCFRALLDAEVRQVAYVPDAGLAGLIRHAQRDAAVRAVPLSTEEEGIALLAGAWLGGQRGALLMQSSGVGNCINLFGLARTCRLPLLCIVTMRGQWGELNPWQVPMGSTTAAAMERAGLLVFEASTAEAVAPTVAAAAAMTFSGAGAAAVLVSQQVLGAKAFTPAAGAASGQEG